MAKARSSGGWFGERLRHKQARLLGKATPKALKQGTMVEKEHRNTLKYIKSNPNTPLKTAEQLIAKDHLNEDPLYYTKLETIENPPTNPIKQNTLSLPVQFSITIPSTQGTDQKLAKKEFNNRIKEAKKWVVDKYYGDTTILAKGDYTADGKLIEEDVAVINVSTTREDYEKNKKELGKFIKDKRKEYEQQQMAYTLEDDLFLYPEDPKKTPV